MKKEAMENVVALITAAFGLVAALAWNTAIQQIFKNIFGDESSVAAMLGYAVLVTLIAVFVTIWMGKLAERSKK